MPPAPAGWRTWKMPPWKVPVWLAPADTAELRTTVPLRASTIEPTGTEAAWVMATGRGEPGTRTRTLPACSSTPMLWPISGVVAGARAGAEAGRRRERRPGRPLREAPPAAAVPGPARPVPRR